MRCGVWPRSLRRVYGVRKGVLGVALVLAATLTTGLLSGCASGSAGAGSPVGNVSGGQTDNLNGIVLPKAYRPPSVSLTDTEGASFDPATDLTRPITLVFFGYTNCPDICGIVMSDMASARLRLTNAQQQQVGVLLITTDPKRDTPQVMRAYLDRFSSDSEGLTGPIATINQVAQAMGVPIEKAQPLPGGGYTIVHGGQILGMLPDGTAPYVWPEATSSAQLAEDLVKILNGQVTSVVEPS